MISLPFAVITLLELRETVHKGYWGHLSLVHDLIRRTGALIPLRNFNKN